MMNFSKMLKQAQKLQDEINKLQSELAQKTIEATAGGGMIKVIASGDGQIISVQIEPEIFQSGDKEMLEDLIVAAVNNALENAKKLFAEELKKITGGIGIPGLPI